MQNRHIQIIDDQIMWLELISDSIKKRNLATQISTFSNCEDGLKLIDKNPPDIVLLDIRFLDSQMQGFDCLRQIKKKNENIKVIMVTNYNNTHMIREALDHKADGYVNKGISIKDLVKAIDIVEKGHRYIYDDDETTQLQGRYSKYNTSKRKLITKCELEVLELVSLGYKSHEIAAKLFRSVHTVITHRKNIVKHLHAKNCYHAVRITLELGLIGSLSDRNN